MNKEYFKINNNNAIIIYGAASIGIEVYDICKELSLPILGFLDKRGDEIKELNGLKVWSLNSPEIDTIDKNNIVFIAVKNVFEHDNIVRDLIKKEFNNIIYMPYNVVRGAGNSDEKYLYEVYDKFMNKKLIKSNIPKTFAVHHYEYKDYSTIEKNEDGRIVYVSMENIYTKKGPTGDVPVIAFISHIAFFRWIDQQDGFSPEKYLEVCTDFAEEKGLKVTNRWKKNIINNRRNIYINMNDSLERDSDFFIKNAPMAKWNPNGYFNLLEGKHRATFLVAKGKRYMPLKISEQDYEKWVNKKQISKIIKSFDESDIYKLHAPIEHPFFYDFLSENGNLYYNLLCEFIFKIASEQYEKFNRVKLDEINTVFVSLNDDGYIARALQRFAINVDVYNKNSIAFILDSLLTKKYEKKETGTFQYAIVEYKYGTDFNFVELLDKVHIKTMLCLVDINLKNEFETIISSKYSLIKYEETYKDGEYIRIYWLEENNSAVWQERNSR